MEPFVELLKQINIAQILVIFAGGWFFYNRLEKKIEYIRDEIKGIRHDIKDLQSDMKKLEFDMIEVKTTLRLKECCMINDERQTKKAE